VTANAPARYKAVATPTFAHFTKSATYTWAVVDPNCGNHGGVTTGEAW
jgi:hypothetical protein